MPAGHASEAVVLDELRALGRAGRIAAMTRMSGGAIADVWLVTYADGSQVVGKTATGAPRDLFAGSGHEFFAEHRLLRYLSEPPAGRALTADDRRAVERLGNRLPELIPAMPVLHLRPGRRRDHRPGPGHPGPLLTWVWRWRRRQPVVGGLVYPGM